MLTYPEYYRAAVKAAGNDQDAIDRFYNTLFFDFGRKLDVSEVAAQVKQRLDKVPVHKNGLLADYSGIFNFEGLGKLADEIIPVLEKNLYGCNLFVDKIYCYRNHHTGTRSSSWLWHYDNNPDEVVKIIVYLTDVDDKSGPFEYALKANGAPDFRHTTRSGYNHWKKPPNNSRIPEGEIGKTIRVSGEAGTLVVFNNNIVHRANVPSPGKTRDIITLRVRPTIKPVDNYVDSRWTTTSDVSGAVPKDPSIKRQT